MNIFSRTKKSFARSSGELMVDEAHCLKNSKSQLYDVLSGFFASFKMLIMGMPLQNNVKGTYVSTQTTQLVLTSSRYLELLALMHFLMPDRLPLNADFELSDINQEAKIKEPHISNETSLPTKSEQILRVEMLALQTHYYKNILTRGDISPCGLHIKAC